MEQQIEQDPDLANCATHLSMHKTCSSSVEMLQRFDFQVLPANMAALKGFITASQTAGTSVVLPALESSAKPMCQHLSSPIAECYVNLYELSEQFTGYANLGINLEPTKSAMEKHIKSTEQDSGAPMLRESR